MKKPKMYWELFSTFFKIGLFTFGGGYAMIPLIEQEVVGGKHWIEEKDVLDILAIAESTPGPLAINSATFVGFKMAGVLGAALATLGVVLPSFVIIGIISMFLNQFKQNAWFNYAFQGIRAGVLVLMINAVVKLGKACPKRAFTYVMLLLAFAVATFTNADIAFVLIGAALVGLAYTLIAGRREKGGDAK